MKTYRKILVLSIICASFSCLTKSEEILNHVKVRTEPRIEKFLGQKIDFSNSSLFEYKEFYEIYLEFDHRKIILNKNKMDVTFYTDPKDNFNKIKANIGFDLYENNIQQRGQYHLNLNCPVTKEWYTDEKLLHQEQIKEGKKISTYNLIFDVLKSEVVDKGTYALSFNPQDVKPIKIEEEDSQKELLRLEHTSSDQEMLRKSIMNICQTIDTDLFMADINRNVITEITPLN